MTAAKDKLVVCTQERREEEPAQHGRQVDAVFLIKRTDMFDGHDTGLRAINTQTMMDQNDRWIDVFLVCYDRDP